MPRIGSSDTHSAIRVPSTTRSSTRVIPLAIWRPSGMR